MTMSGLWQVAQLRQSALDAMSGYGCNRADHVLNGNSPGLHRVRAWLQPCRLCPEMRWALAPEVRDLVQTHCEPKNMDTGRLRSPVAVSQDCYECTLASPHI